MDKNSILCLAKHNPSNNFAHRYLYDENGVYLVGVFCLTISQIQLKYVANITSDRTGILCCSLFQDFHEENGRMVKRFSPLLLIDLKGNKDTEKVLNCVSIPSLRFADKKGNNKAFIQFPKSINLIVLQKFHFGYKIQIEEELKMFI